MIMTNREEGFSTTSHLLCMHNPFTADVENTVEYLEHAIGIYQKLSTITYYMN
jgi:hypothetical protein